MPITKELENIQKLESAGFDHKQSEALTEIIEHAQWDGREDLKDFIRDQIKELRNEIKQDIANTEDKLHNEINGIHNEINGMRNEINGIRSEINGIRNELTSRLTRWKFAWPIHKKTY